MRNGGVVEEDQEKLVLAGGGVEVGGRCDFKEAWRHWGQSLHGGRRTAEEVFSEEYNGVDAMRCKMVEDKRL